MKVLSLFTPPADPDAWHHVAAPGGYEWWHFDAEDVSGQIQITAIFFDGFVFHPGYLRRYASFLRRPTRRLPPTAGEFPCVNFTVYEDGKVAAQFMSQVPPTDFCASVDRTDVRIGASHVTRDSDGTLRLKLHGTPWKLTWKGPKLLGDEELSAELTFRPRVPGSAMERTFLSRKLSGAEHRWVIADPLCDVAGKIYIGKAGNATGAVGREIAFKGRGYHDHNYGTAPIGPGLKRWVRGRAIAGDHMYTFHFAQARKAELPDAIHLVRADALGRSELPVTTTEVDWTRHTAMGLAYPRTIHFPPFLKLTTPRIVDSSPFYTRLVYKAELDGGRETTAFCEVAYPHRLRWPILGRMIERSIHEPV